MHKVGGELEEPQALGRGVPCLRFPRTGDAPLDLQWRCQGEAGCPSVPEVRGGVCGQPGTQRTSEGRRGCQNSNAVAEVTIIYSAFGAQEDIMDCRSVSLLPGCTHT